MLIAMNNKKERVAIDNSTMNEKYFCQFCGEELCRKMGHVRCHHFSHKANSHCTDSIWYDMSDWHINWQNKFPTNTQEILKINSNGKKHIADVLINNKTVVEFQHSNLPYEIFNDRNEFYNSFGYNVIWVFDGNHIFDNGYSGGKMYYNNPLKPLAKVKKIPPYLNIFVEGTMNYNLFEEEGKFLYHVSDLSSIGIDFNGKIKIEDFIKVVNNDESFTFGYSEDFIEEEIKEREEAEAKINDLNKKTLIDIINDYPDANQLIVFNTKTGYDVSIDRYNIDRVKEGKFIKGKMKLHQTYGNFQNKQLNEIYYVNDPVWIYQMHY